MNSIRAGLAHVACLGVALSGCASPAAHDDGSIEGELVTFVSRSDNAPPRRTYSLRTADGALYRLSFDVPPEVAPGTTVRVWGDTDEATGSLRVAHYEQPALPTGEPLEPEVATKVTQETYAFVLVDLGQGAGITTAQAQAGVFGQGTNAKPSFAQYLAESSFGGRIASGDVIGPLSYDITKFNWQTCAVGDNTSGISQLTNTLKPQITKTYNHYMWYLGPGNQCDFGGIGEEGSINKPAANAWYANELSCGVTVQEVQHNLGFFHEDSMTCPNKAIFTDTPMTDCTTHEYGFGGPSTISVMGSQCGHNTAFHKWYAGWLTGCNGVKVKTSGTFTLLPIEQSCSGGVQALQVPMPKTRQFKSEQSNGTVSNLAYYYLELRTPTGIDSWMKQPAVFVHVSEDVHAMNRSNTWEWILDMNTATNQSDGLGAGQSFTDPAGGVSFTVQSISATSATVNVTITGGTGTTTCIDGSTFNGPGPSTCTPPDGGVDGGTTSTSSSSSSGSATTSSSTTSSSGSTSSSSGSTSSSSGIASSSSGSASSSSGSASSSSGSTSSSGHSSSSGTASATTGTGSQSSSSGGPKTTGSAGGESAGAGGAGGGGSAGHETGNKPGCSCRAAGEEKAPPSYPMLLGAAFAVAVLRGKRRARSGDARR